MIPTRDDLYLFKDEDYGVYLAKDYYHGIVVQVARLRPVRIDMNTGKKVHQSAPQVTHEAIIPACKGEISSPVNAASFKQACVKEIATATAALSALRQLDMALSGILNEESKKFTLQKQYQVVFGHDHYEGVVCLILRQSAKHKQNEVGAITRYYGPQSVWKKSMGVPARLELQKINAAISEVSAEANRMLQQFTSVETMMDGVLADYFSQAR